MLLPVPGNRVDLSPAGDHVLPHGDRLVDSLTELRQVPRRYGWKEVVLHELGCPAGWTHRDSVIGSSEAKQQEFFELAFQQFRSTPELRAAYVFQMVDWSQELTELYVEAFEDEPLPPDFLDSFKEWLETSGFITYYEGRIRSAWAVFLEHIEAEAASR